jgi:hypothetical protein
MASRHLFPVELSGAEHAGEGPQFDYLASGGASVVHLLGAKLINLEPVDVESVFGFWALDNIHRDVVTIDASQVYDLLADIRYDNDPGGLKRMLRRGLQGATLNYRNTFAGTVYPVQLVAVVGASDKDLTPIRPDRDLRHAGNYETRIHIRRVDGGSLDGLLTGANTL